MRSATHVVLLVAGSLAAAACTVNRPLGPEGPTPRQTIHLESPTAFPIRTTVAAGTPRCWVTSLDGTVRAVAGDTIRFTEVRALRLAPGSSRCNEPGAPYVVLSDVERAETAAVKVSAWRTVFLVIGMGAAIGAAVVGAIICGMGECS